MSSISSTTPQPSKDPASASNQQDATNLSSAALPQLDVANQHTKQVKGGKKVDEGVQSVMPPVDKKFTLEGW